MSVEEEPTEEWSFKTIGPKTGIQLVPKSKSAEELDHVPLKLLAISPDGAFFAAASSDQDGVVVLGRIDELHTALDGKAAAFESKHSKRRSNVLQIAFLSNSKQLAVATKREIEILNLPDLKAAASLKLSDDFLDFKPLQSSQGFVYSTMHAGVTKVTDTEELKVTDLSSPFAVLPDDSIVTSQDAFQLPDSAGEIKWIGEVARGQLGVVTVDAEDDDEHLLFIQNGSGSDEWLLVSDACPPNADASRPWTWFSYSIASFPTSHENTVVAACSQSTDLLLLAQGKRFTPMDDSDKLPFTSEDEDVSPLGLALDLSNDMTVYSPVKGVDSASKLPILLLLSQEGKLLTWAIASKDAITEGTVARPANTTSSAQLENIKSLDFDKKASSSKENEKASTTEEDKKASISEEDVEEISLDDLESAKGNFEKKSSVDSKEPESPLTGPTHDSDEKDEPSHRDTADALDDSIKNLGLTKTDSNSLGEKGLQSSEQVPPAKEPSSAAESGKGPSENIEDMDSTKAAYSETPLQSKSSPNIPQTQDEDTERKDTSVNSASGNEEENNEALSGTPRTLTFQFNTPSSFGSSWGKNTWASSAKDGSPAPAQLTSTRFGAPAGANNHKEPAEVSQSPFSGKKAGGSLFSDTKTFDQKPLSNSSPFTDFARSNKSPFSLNNKNSGFGGSGNIDRATSTSGENFSNDETINKKKLSPFFAAADRPSVFGSHGKSDFSDNLKTGQVSEDTSDFVRPAATELETASSENAAIGSPDRPARTIPSAGDINLVSEAAKTAKSDGSAQELDSFGISGEASLAPSERSRSLDSIEWQGVEFSTFEDFVSVLESFHLEDLNLFDGIYAETNVLFQVLDQNLKVLEKHSEYKRSTAQGNLDNPDLASIHVADINAFMETNLDHFKEVRAVAERSTQSLSLAMNLMNETEKLSSDIELLQSEIDLQEEEQSAAAYQLRPLPLAYQIMKQELHRKFGRLNESLKAAKLRSLLADVEKRGIPDQRSLIVAFETVDSRLKMLEKRISHLDVSPLTVASDLAAFSFKNGGHKGRRGFTSSRLSGSLIDEEVEAADNYLKSAESYQVEDLTTLVDF